MEAIYTKTIIFLPFSLNLRIFIIPRYMSWVFFNILSLRGHLIAKFIGEYRAEGFTPCMRSAREKFELINQDSVGGKNYNLLASMKVNSH